jgi:RNA polymerase sigma-70 factor (ECF subfamily)
MTERSTRAALRVLSAPRPEAGGGDANDGAIAAGLRAGRLDALARAFDRWHQRVRVLARRLVSDAAAEDVVQETFAALLGAVARFRGEVDLESFVLGIAVKRARRHHRAAARLRRALERLTNADKRGPRDPEHDAYRRELAQRLGAALLRLPPAQREAFVLCEIEEMTSARAAALADVPEATVRTRLFHARRRLRDLLNEDHEP